MGKLAEYLLTNRLLTQDQLEQALEEQNHSQKELGEILINMGFVSPQDVGKAWEAEMGVPYISLVDYEVDPLIAQMVPEQVVRRFTALPIKMEGGKLIVAMPPPLDLLAIDEIKLLTGLKIKPVLATRKELTQAINEQFSITQTTKQALVDMRLQGLAKETEGLIEEEFEEETSIVRFVNSIIRGAIDARASDIHLEPQHPEMRVRYRVDGILHDVMTVPSHVEPEIISRIKVMADMDITEQRKPQDGHISINIVGKMLDLRVSTVSTINGEKIVMRVLDKDTMLLDLEELGLSFEDEQTFKSLIAKPYGMILVTGPTGSGKTTTLYSVLNRLDPITRNIITVENPVEYKLSNINQIQVNPSTGITFATALRTIVRQDPDVIIVGEVRDLETADTAIQAALTGHLVFGTIHTNDAIGTISRLLDMGVEPFLIASSVIGVVAQRLARIICPDCKEYYQPSKEMLDQLGLKADANEIKFSRGKGCKFCFNTGYRGRTGVFEVLRISEDIRRLIIEKAPEEKIKKVAMREEMRTLQERGMEKVLSGISTLEEIESKIYIEG